MPVKKVARKVKEEPKLIEFVVPNAKMTALESIVHNFEQDHNVDWNEAGNIATFKKCPGHVTIIFPNEDDGGERGDFKIIADQEGKAWLEKRIAKESMDITSANLTGTVFEKVGLTDIKTGGLSLLGRNLTVFQELDKVFKDMGVKNVLFRRTGFEYYSDAYFSELTVLVQPEISGGRAIQSQFWENYRNVPGFVQCEAVVTPFELIGKEKAIDLKFHNHKIGMYLPQRNLVLLFFNPLKVVDLKQADSYQENEYLKLFFADLAKEFTAHKIEKVDNSDFVTRMTISKFNKISKGKLSELRLQKSEWDAKIVATESQLNDHYSNSYAVAQQITGLEGLDEDNIESFVEEMTKLNAVPIVESAKLENGRVNITFKPTTIKIPFARSLDGAGRSDKIREMFIGRITFHIAPGGQIDVSSDLPTVSGYQHPHGNQSKKPCLGHGEGINTLHKLIGERKFSEAVYIFWMWIKRWRPEDCYVKPWDYYDDRLKQGLPVFDNVGNRITMNDAKLLADGEQVKLSKHDNHDANFEKYKDYRPQE